MFKGKTYQEYKVITSHDLYEYCDLPEEMEEKFREDLLEEQRAILKEEMKTVTNVIIHFIEDTHFCDDCYRYSSAKEIEDYLEYLAIKDGINLVRFSNGNLGFVAYYNGHENGFEIIQTEMTEREFEEVGQDMDWADYIE